MGGEGNKFTETKLKLELEKWLRAIKSTGRSSRGPMLGSQNPHGAPSCL